MKPKKKFRTIQNLLAGRRDEFSQATFSAHDPVMQIDRFNNDDDSHGSRRQHAAIGCGDRATRNSLGMSNLCYELGGLGVVLSRCVL
jgi:hypothetical protein